MKLLKNAVNICGITMNNSLDKPIKFGTKDSPFSMIAQRYYLIYFMQDSFTVVPKAYNLSKEDDVLVNLDLHFTQLSRAQILADIANKFISNSILRKNVCSNNIIMINNQGKILVIDIKTNCISEIIGLMPNSFVEGE